MQKLRRPRSRLGAVAISTALLLAACQGDRSGSVPVTHTSAGLIRPADAIPSASSSSEPPATPTGEPIAAAPVPAAAVDPRTDGFDVVVDEDAITLEAGAIRPGRVTLILHNAGHLTHGLEIKLEGSGSGSDRKKIETRTFGAGETLRVEADLLPGVYEIESDVADHPARGTRAVLEVRADAPLTRAAPDTPAAGTARIVQFAFVPASVDVPVGTRMTWTNRDSTPHTVTEDGGAFDSRQLDPGASFSVALNRSGAFTYHCEIHPTMVGTISVH